jgi:PAS domain S-box-containing protein
MERFESGFSTASSPAPGVGAGSESGYCLLLVDDDPDFVSLIRKNLEDRLPISEILTATNVREGEIRLSEHDVDCIVSDYDMPEETGLDLLQAVRDEDANLPFILFTGQGSETLASEAISAGVTDYLQKTVDGRFEALSNLIRGAVDNYRAQLARDQLAETASMLSAVLNNTPNAIYLLNGAGAIADVNEPALRATQYTEANLLGTGLDSILEPTDSGKSIQEYLQQNSGAEFEAKQVGRRGDRQAVKVQIEQIPESDQVSSIAVVRDISEQKDEETTIRELNQTGLALMEARSKTDVADTIVEAASDTLSMPYAGIWLHESSGHYSLTSTSNNAESVFTQNAVDDNSEVHNTFIEGGIERFSTNPSLSDRLDATTISNRLLFSLGEHGVLEIPVRDQRLYDERDIRMSELLATSGERALNQTVRESQIRAEQRFFNTAINTVNDIFLSVTDSQEIVRTNDQLEGLAGTLPEDNQTLSLEDLFSGETLSTMESAISEAFNTGAGSIEQVLSVNGSKQVFEFQFSRMEHPVDDESLVIGFGRNISPLKEKQQELSQQNERLEQFSSMVSHDLKNPLSIASGHFDLVQKDLEDADSEVSADSVEAVDDALDRMQELIDDLLTLARQGEAATEIERLSLPEAVDEAWGVVDEEKGTLNIETEREINADRTQLQHVLENLLSNAVIHGGDAVTVTVGELSGQDGFYISDDGSGIPPGEREQIFEEGFTTAESGTGFGLMIVEDIIEQHGWDITVAESATGGARFEIVTRVGEDA